MSFNDYSPKFPCYTVVFHTFTLNSMISMLVHFYFKKLCPFTTKLYFIIYLINNFLFNVKHIERFLKIGLTIHLLSKIVSPRILFVDPVAIMRIWEIILWEIPQQEIQKNVGKILSSWLEAQLIIISIYHIGLAHYHLKWSDS